MTIQIPCDTIVRLSNLVNPAHSDPVFQTLRLDNGRVIATDRTYMAIERTPTLFAGVHYIRLTTALLEQCRTESAFHSSLTVIPTPVLKHTTCKTTLGWSTPDNIGYYPDTETTDYDYWYERCVKPCLEPAPSSKGAMIWITDRIEALAATSPSGCLIFETNIDADNRPTLVRDINSPDWVGVFMPRVSDGKYHAPAAVPTWLRGV